MIEPEIIGRAEDLVLRYKRLEDYSPHYVLDGSWQSLETLNLIYLGLAGNIVGDGEATDLVTDISAYLATVAATFWSEFDSYVSAYSSAAHGITIKATGGEACGEEGAHEIRIEKDLFKLITDPPQVIEIIPGFSRPLVPGDNFLKHYAFGLFTGRSSFGKGVWEGAGFAKTETWHDGLLKVLAKESAEHYGRIFSDEELGKVAELYLNKIFWPPAFSSEPSLGIGGAFGLLMFFEEFGIAPDKQASLLKNLIVFGDETCSNAAKALFTASLGSLPTTDEVYLFASQSRLTRILRPTVTLIRRETGLVEEWITSEPEEDHLLSFEIERAFGFLHWVKFSEQKVLNRSPELSEVILNLAIGETKKASYDLEKLIDEDPRDLELRVQQAYLFLDAGEFERCEAGLRQLLTETGGEQEARLFHCLGLCSFTKGEPEKALGYLRSARSMPARDAYAEAELDYTYALGLFMTEDYKGAEKQAQLNKKASKRYCHFENDMLLLRVYERLGRYDEHRELLEKLVVFCPFHREVFSAIWSKEVW